MDRRVFLAAWGILLALGSLAEARKWTDVAGNQISAEYVRVHEGEVILSQGSRVIRCPYDHFCELDKAYIRQQMEADRSKSQRHTGVSQIGGPVVPEETDDDARELRTWRDLQGNKILAQYTGFNGGRIELLKEGKRVSYRYELFSPQDQMYVAQILISEGREDEIPKKKEEREQAEGGYDPDERESRGPGPAERGSQIPEVPDYEVITSSERSEPEDMGGEHEASRGSSRGHAPPSMSHIPMAPHTSAPIPRGPSFAPSRSSQSGYRCSKCNKELPADIKAGDNCPHCGAYLGYKVEADGTKSYAGMFSWNNHRFLFRVGIIGFFLLMGALGVLAKVFR